MAVDSEHCVIFTVHLTSVVLELYELSKLYIKLT